MRRVRDHLYNELYADREYVCIRWTLREPLFQRLGPEQRFLPVTKAQSKEVMPVLGKPTIQYVVEEAIAAGIEDILIIMGVGSGQLSDT